MLFDVKNKHCKDNLKFHQSVEKGKKSVRKKTFALWTLVLILEAETSLSF